jgi:methionine-rich copper-binding protein CopC
VRNCLITLAALVVGAASSLMLAPGVAAQNPIKSTEPVAGAVLESPPSSVEVWLEEPLSTEAKAGLRVLHNQSETRVDLPAALPAEAAANPPTGDNDDRVTVALATFGAAAAAVVVGLLAYLLRVRLGLVKPPPPPEEPHGSH